MKSKGKIQFFIALLYLIVFYIILYSVIGQEIFSHGDYDSYTRQAACWWEGQANLPQNVPWLEIAEYQGEFFVSFPPFPAIIQFLLYPVFGMAMPDNLINTLFGIGTFILVYLTFRRKQYNHLYSSILALLIVLGSNLFYLSITGWVWFSAQVQAFFFSVLCIYLIFSKRKIAWYFSFLALGAAFACRPFQIVYFPLVLYLLYKNLKADDTGRGFIRTMLSCVKYVLPLVVIGALAAVFNYVRFDSFFEFGHNYLPEFTNEPQFSLSYIGKNFLEILKLPRIVDGTLMPPKFNGTLFFLVNPVYVLLFVGIFRQKFGAKQLIYIICLTIHMLLMLAHRTMGGWQFGSRYLVDMIPFMMIIISEDRKLLKKSYESKKSVLLIILTMIGVIINVYGAIWFYTTA